MRDAVNTKAKMPSGFPLKLFLWTAVVSFLFGLGAIGEPLEDLARTARNYLHTNKASGDIVLVEIDRKSIEEIGTYPWRRTVHADIVDEATKLGADHLYFDVVFAGRTTPQDDEVFRQAMERAGNVTLAAVEERNTRYLGSSLQLPMEEFQDDADMGSINAYFNFQTAAWDLAVTDKVGGKVMPSFAAKMAGVTGEVGETFPVDYSIDVTTVPKISATDLVHGRVDKSLVEGKTLIVGISVVQLGDQVFIPGRGRMGGVFVQILGAETLKNGKPVSLGWVPAFLVALAAFALACWRPDPRTRFTAMAIAFVVLAGLPVILEANGIFVDIMAGMAILLYGFALFGYRFFKSRGLVNELTGLPNLTALRADRKGKDLPLIAARVHNFAEIVSTLNAAGERRLVEQIAARLALGRQSGMTLYQGDEGIFAWFAEPRTAIGNHLEALHALFRSPVTIDDQPYDIAVSFGVEVGSSRNLASRLGSALVAADEADAEAIKWKYHDPARLQDVPWKLSLLSQLDKAIDNGEVWLAFQPQVDLKSRRVVAAEALARWTHPEKGPISPTEFIAAAEQQGRISALTDFVVDAAAAGVAELRKSEPDFTVAVNLSARMLSDRKLAARIMNALEKHGVPTGAITLELTETAALDGTGADIDLLAELRELGFSISIDDYGTGLSTLDYLKKVPASELKIDQSFVRSMRDNRSDLIMVQSTIALAHSLGRKVVAEGVEDTQILEQLTMMKCDIAQGFAVGRPMGLQELKRRLLRDKQRRVA